LVIGWCGSPFKDPIIFQEFDLILSNVPELVKDFLKNGHSCYHLNHAFDPRVLEKIDTRITPSVNFSFIGSVIKNTGFHYGREALLIELLNNTDLQIWSKVDCLTRIKKIEVIVQQLAYYTSKLLLNIGFNKNFLSTIPRFRKYANMEERPDYSNYVDSRIAKRALPPLYGISMYDKIKSSKITLNSHGEISPKYASNMRLYEATGIGTCLLTDWKINLKDLYKPELEIATYRNADECIEKVHYLLENERERRTIAKAGQKRTLTEHTIYHRAEQLDEIIKSHLKKNS
jgi:spore maturation protein CgeB